MSSKYFLPFLLLQALFSAFTASAQVAREDSYIVVERYSGRVLLADNSERKHAMGDFCQIATAKVALDWSVASKTSLSTKMVVPPYVTDGGTNNLGLRPGDVITMRDAIYASSMVGDGACALALADFVGKNILNRRMRGGNPVATFVAEMNNLAQKINMRSTRFSHPSSSLQMTTPSDMARLARSVVQTKGYNFYVKQRSRKVTVTGADGAERKLTLTNTNRLVGVSGVSGLKAQGFNSVLSVDRKPHVVKVGVGGSKVTPRQLVVIVFGNAQKEVRAKQLITEGWKLYDAWHASGFPASKDRKEYLK